MGPGANVTHIREVERAYVFATMGHAYATFTGDPKKIGHADWLLKRLHAYYAEVHAVQVETEKTAFR